MIDQNHVSEILRAMPKGISAEDFMARCQPDINAGYGAEVEEAFWRTFKIGAMIDGAGRNSRIVFEPR
jgi:hypothetical protein